MTLILLISTFIVIYYKISLLYQIQIILWILVFFISNLFISINPFSSKLYSIRILSIIIILYIIYLDSNNTTYLTVLLAPFSLDKIHFVHDFQVKSLNFHKTKTSIVMIKTLTKDLINFLDNLNEEDNYWLSLSFYPDINGYGNNEGIKLYISDPILINKNSCPILLSKFIMNRLNLMIDFYYLDDSIINSRDPVIIIKYTEIELE